MSSRGRLLLSVLSLLLAGRGAQAAVELSGIRTMVERQSTTFLLRLPAPVDYSPTRIGPRLFVVDMTGVSTNRSAESQLLQSPLVRSYRLLSYRGADNQPHLALEITLKEEAKINLVQAPEGLQVLVQSDAGTAAPPSPPHKAAPAPIPPKTVIREVSVAQPEGGSGLEVEIAGDGAMQYRTMVLRNPDRLVVDIPNAVNQIRQPRLEVNTPPLRSVRIAQLRRRPLIARVVLDLDTKVAFQVRPQSKSLQVVLGASSASTEPAQTAQSSPVPAEQEAPGLSAKQGEEENLSSATVPAASSEPEPVLVASNEGTVPASLARTPRPSRVGFREPSPPVPASEVLETPSRSSATAVPAAHPAAPEVQAAPRAEPASSPQPLLLAQQTSAPPSAVRMAQAAQGQSTTYTGEPISVNLKDVDLKDFFRLIHEISGLNIVLDPTVSGNVTIVLDEVPWDQALEIVMKNNGLGKEVMGNVVRIAKFSTLEAEEKQRRDLAIAVEQGRPRETVTRILSYAKAADVVATLKRFLSPRGEVIPDARTNMLILTDIPEVIAQVDRLIGTLDQKSQQVEIEARIVAASRSFARDIGTQLAASGNSGRVVLGGTGLVGESPIKRGTTPPLFIGTPPDPPQPGEPFKFANVAQPLAVNLAAVGPTSGMSFLISTPLFVLDGILTAAESRGIGKLLSRPKIITQNNMVGTVQQGVKIPVQTSINNTITTTFVNAVLKLTVTPQITQEGTIFLTIDIENTSIDTGIPRILGIPALNTQQALTQVLISNGGTVFFGGVIQTSNSLTEQQVPLLGSIPLVGNLFKRKSTSSDTRELLFFITPRLVQS